MLHIDHMPTKPIWYFDLQQFAEGDPPPTTPFAAFATEAELNARLDQESKTRQEALAKELGFDSVESMKAAAKEKKAADDASKSELEREKAARTQAEAAAKAEKDKANRYRIEADIKLAAMEAGFVDPTDAIALVDRASIKVDDKDAVTGVKEAVEALARAKPHLVGEAKPGGSPGSPGNGPGQKGKAADPWQQGQDMAKARNEARKAQGKGWA